MEVNSEQSLWIILSITHLAPVLISSMVLWLMQATRRWVGGGEPGGGGGGPAGRRRHLSGSAGRAGRPPGGHRAWGGGGAPREMGGLLEGEKRGDGGEKHRCPPHSPGGRSSLMAFLGAELGFTPGSFGRRCKVSGKAGMGQRGGGEHGGAGDGDTTQRNWCCPGRGTGATSTEPDGAAAPPPSCLAQAPLLVNY